MVSTSLPRTVQTSRLFTNQANAFKPSTVLYMSIDSVVAVNNGERRTQVVRGYGP